MFKRVEGRQVLSPRMKDAEKANLGSQILVLLHEAFFLKNTCYVLTIEWLREIDHVTATTR